MLWPEGRRKALTFSYDDGVVQDRRFVALMRKYGLRGTFNLNSGFLGWHDSIVRDDREVDHSHIPQEEVAELYKDMEVAVHTVTHPDLCVLHDAAVLSEVLDDRRALEKLMGFPIHGMAYPFGTTDARVQRLLHKCGIRYARGVRTTGGFCLPEDPLDWTCSCHHYDLEPLIEPFLTEDGVFKLLSVWGHSYEFDQKDEWEKIERQLARLGGHDDVWYATNIEIFDYIAAFRSLDTSVNGQLLHNESAIPLWFLDREQTIRLDPGRMLCRKPVSREQVHPFRIWKG